ncbi:hypothetical protein MNAN1_001293 [Malassezia nana]|uniref:Meiotically up-regulated protein Msb1/Mug8 domain-containing protein n=1 Tax=Malassezia nana TaxID=180528 RepID=A0AAF0EIL4_9BASI|nr:hypothetical protein MNAN1_001293 [Malassezia nana]
MVAESASPSSECDRLFMTASPALQWIASHSRSEPGSTGPSRALSRSPPAGSSELPSLAADAPRSSARDSLGLGLSMDPELSRPLPSLPSKARLNERAPAPVPPTGTLPTLGLGPGPWDLSDSFLQTSSAPPHRPEMQPATVYGYTGLGWEHQLDMEVATAYVIRIMERIRALGVDAPLLLSSMAVDLSASDSVRLIRTVVESLHAPSAKADRALDQELQFANVYSLVALLKWVLARIGRVVAERAPGQSGQPLVLVQERGFVPWPSYMSWRLQEKQQGYPTSAYLQLTHMLETRVARLLDVLMDFFALVATHSSQNQMTPSRLGRHMGVLLFGLPEDASFADTYAWYVQASNATEHILVAFIRYHVSVATQSTYLPRRLLRLVDDYPRMLSPDLNASSAAVRTVPATYIARHVQRYAKDLLQRSAWPAPVAHMELGPETRKQLNLVVGQVPRPGSSLQAPDVTNEVADGLGTPSMQRWHEFAFEGFDDLDASALAFDLRESDRRQRMQRVESMHWFQFEERGFHQGADDNSRWDWVMRLDEPLHDNKEATVPRSHSAGLDESAPPFHYRPEPHIAETVIDELFPEVWADYLVGNGWSNRDERVHREASFAVLQLRGTQNGRTTTAWYVLEEVVPASYRDALNASLCPARRSRPMLRKLNQFRLVRAGLAPESVVAVLYRLPSDTKGRASSDAAPSYAVPSPTPSSRPAPAKHATVLPPRQVPPKATAEPRSTSPPTENAARPRPSRKSVPPDLQAKAAEARTTASSASPTSPGPPTSPAVQVVEPTPASPKARDEPPLNKKRSIQRILSSFGSPRSTQDSPHSLWTPFSPRVPAESEDEAPQRTPRILSGLRKRSSQWILKGKQSLRSMRSTSGEAEDAEVSSPRLRSGRAFGWRSASRERASNQPQHERVPSQPERPSAPSQPERPSAPSQPERPSAPSQHKPPTELASPPQPEPEPVSPLVSSPLQTLPPLAESSPIRLSSPETSPAVPSLRSPSVVPRPSLERMDADLPPLPPLPPSRPRAEERPSPALSQPHSSPSSYGNSPPVGTARPWAASPALSNDSTSPVAPAMSWNKPVSPTFSSSAAAYLSSPESATSKFDDAYSAESAEPDELRAAPAIPLEMEVQRPLYRLSRISERSEDDVTRSLAHGTAHSHPQLAEDAVASSSSRTLTEPENEQPASSPLPPDTQGLGLRMGLAQDADLPDIPEAPAAEPAVDTQSTGTHEAWAEAEAELSEPVPVVHTPTFRTLDLPDVTPERAAAPWQPPTTAGLPPYLLRDASQAWPAVAAMPPMGSKTPERSPSTPVVRSPRMDPLPVVQDCVWEAEAQGQASAEVPAQPEAQAEAQAPAEAEAQAHKEAPAEAHTKAPAAPWPSMDDMEDQVDAIPPVRPTLPSTVSRISLRTDTSMDNAWATQAPPRASTPKEGVALNETPTQGPFLAGFGRPTPTRPSSERQREAPPPSRSSASIADMSHTTMNGHTDIPSLMTSRSVPPVPVTTEATPLAGFVPRKGSVLESTERPGAQAQAQANEEAEQVPHGAQVCDEAEEREAEVPAPTMPVSRSTITVRERSSKPVTSAPATTNQAADTSLPGEFLV